MKWYIKNKDRFRLDLSRLVKIDGHQFIITGFSADRSYVDGTGKLIVEFESFSDFEKRLTIPKEEV